MTQHKWIQHDSGQGVMVPLGRAGRSLMRIQCFCQMGETRPPDKSAYLYNNFLISQPKYMLRILKRTFTLSRFFLARDTYV